MKLLGFVRRNRTTWRSRKPELAVHASLVSHPWLSMADAAPPLESGAQPVDTSIIDDVVARFEARISGGDGRSAPSDAPRRFFCKH